MSEKPEPGCHEAPAFVGGYQLLEKIGFGAVARVFRARHVHPRHADRIYALKLLNRRLERADHFRRLFERELCLLSDLRHPNIVQVFEGGVAQSGSFIAMELIAGANLSTLLSRRNGGAALPLVVRMHIAAETLNALIAAHGLSDTKGNNLGVVHRDVHATNVLVSFDGAVKLADFGIASFAQETGQPVMGKPGYVAPEQFFGAPMDQRVDQFSFGALLYELACASRAFVGEDEKDVMRANLRARFRRPRIVNPELDPGLEKVIVRALRANPAKRYPSVLDLADDLGPHVPSKDGMAMMLATIMRDALFKEYAAQVHDRLGARAKATTERTFAVFAPHMSLAHRARASALRRAGVRVTVCHSEAELTASLGKGEMMAGMFVDVSAASMAPTFLPEALANRHGVMPVVATCDELSIDAAKRAERLGAVDLLVGVQSQERINVAVVQALASSPLGAVACGDIGTPKNPVRLLLMTRDKELASRFSNGLSQYGYAVDVAVNGYAALRKIEQVTYQGILLDGPVGFVQVELAEELRTHHGMGMVPLVWLIRGGDDPTGIVRSASVPRGAEPQAVAGILGRMHADLTLGRGFVRFDTSFPVTLDWDGCPVVAQATNISRGGMMVACSTAPAVGRTVRATLCVPDSPDSVRVNGRIVRVVHRASGQPFGVAIEFEMFIGQDERTVLQHIGRLLPTEAAA